jgi:hypothetical protein
MFAVSDDQTKLTSAANGLTFHIGPFDTPSVGELWELLDTLPPVPGDSGLSFENISGSAKTLHLDASNAGGKRTHLILQALQAFKPCLPADDVAASFVLGRRMRRPDI